MKKKTWHLNNDQVVKNEIEEMMANQIVIEKLKPASFRDIAAKLKADGFKITHEGVRLIYNKYYGKPKTKEEKQQTRKRKVRRNAM